MRTGKQWVDGVETSASPKLMMGWRPRARSLLGATVDLHEDTHEELRSVASAALERLAGMEPVPYGDAVLPTANEEYLVRPLEELRGGSDADTGSETNEEESRLADVLALVDQVDQLDVLSAGQLRDGSFTFYAVVLPQLDGETVAFIRGTSPTRVLSRAAFFGRYSGSLRRSERPDLLLELDVDLVITRDEVAILRRSTYDRLFADLDELAAAVPSDIAALQSAMPELALAPGSAETLSSLCTRLPSFAKRLHRLALRTDLAVVTKVELELALGNHGENATDWLDQNGDVTLTDERARQYLDVLEGRWWTSDFTGERRRADAFRRR